MATHLYRLGGWAFERRRTVLVAWIALLAVVLACAMAFKGQTSDKFVVPGTESQQAQDLLEQKFPAASGASARVVFAAPEGEKLTDPDNRAAVRASVAQASGAAEVSAVTDPFETKALSPDGRIGFADVIYPVPADEIEDGLARRARGRRRPRARGRPAGRLRRPHRRPSTPRPAPRAPA